MTFKVFKLTRLKIPIIGLLYIRKLLLILVNLPLHNKHKDHQLGEIQKSNKSYLTKIQKFKIKMMIEDWFKINPLEKKDTM